MNPIHSLIFDLDGTLLNTIADLAHSTNYALEKSGFPTHAIEAYKYFVVSISSSNVLCPRASVRRRTSPAFAALS